MLKIIRACLSKVPLLLAFFPIAMLFWFAISPATVPVQALCFSLFLLPWMVFFFVKKM